MKYLIAIIVFIAALLSIGYITGSPRATTSTNSAIQNVTVTSDTQIVEIKAKGGYQPRNSVAKAGIKTILRFTTKGTFDCSSSIRIPSLGIDKILPASGATDIDLGVQPVGTLRGSCGMGMYPFSISFN